MSEAPAKLAIYLASDDAGPFRQGEVLSDVLQRRIDPAVFAETGKYEVVATRHPLAIILSQDCDLEQDYASRYSEDSAKGSQIGSVVLCPAYSVTELGHEGSRSVARDIRRRITQNQDIRYHCLPAADASADRAGVGLDALVIDFKELFSVTPDELYVQLKAEARRRCRLSTVDCAHLLHRFVSFFGRVAIDRPYDI